MSVIESMKPMYFQSLLRLIVKPVIGLLKSAASSIHLMLVLILTAVPLLAATESSTGYETGLQNDGNSLIGVVEPRPASTEASRNFARSGVWSLRSELNKGETTVAGIRSECNQHYLYTPSGSTVPIIQRGVRGFYGFSVLLDPTPGNYNTDSTSEVIMQLKHGGGDAVFQLLTQSGKFKCWTENDDGFRRRTDIVYYQKGIWYDFVFEHLPSYQGAGEIRLYYKKATDASYSLALEWIGPTLRENADCYWKWGMYKPVWSAASDKRVIYHDNLRIGRSFAEADPSLMPPIAPAGLRVTTNPTGASLDWEDSPEQRFASYRVYRSESMTGPFVEIARGVGNSTYFDSTAASGITYYYHVTTINDQNLESVFSNLGSDEQVSVLRISNLSPKSPNGEANTYESSTTILTGLANYGGTVSCVTAAPIPVEPDVWLTQFPQPTSATYSMKVSGATLVGNPDVTVNFKVKLTATDGDGLLVRKLATGWSTDKGKNGGNEARALDLGETIRVEVVDISVNKPGLTAVFSGFKGATFAGSATPSFNLSSGVATGSGSHDNLVSLASLAFDIQVTSSNHPPTTENAFVEVSEGVPSGTSLVTLVSSDPDPNDVPSYKITAGNDGRFAIDPVSGEISTVGRLDFETSASYLLTVSAEDQFGGRAFASVTISVTDVANDDSDNDQLPDEWEVEYFGSVAARSGSGDADLDGLTNHEEQLGGTNPLVSGAIYEAESAAVTDCLLNTYYGGFSGTGYMLYGTNGSLLWNVNVPKSGNYQIFLRHYTESSRDMTLTVNGQVSALTLQGTGAAWAFTTPISVSLNSGANSIRLSRGLGSGNRRVDRMVIDASTISDGDQASIAGNFAITQFQRISPTMVRLVFQSTPGGSYVIESSESLEPGSWETRLEHDAEHDLSEVEFTHDASDRMFFRVRKPAHD